MPGSRWPAASGDAGFAPYLAGKPATSVALFWRFTELARGAGPVIFELQNGPVILRGTQAGRRRRAPAARNTRAFRSLTAGARPGK